MQQRHVGSQTPGEVSHTYGKAPQCVDCRVPAGKQIIFDAFVIIVILSTINSKACRVYIHDET